MPTLTTTGLTIDTVDEIIAAFEADQKANIDSQLNVEADSVAGQLNATYGAALATLNELLLAIYNSAFPDQAEGTALSNLAALTGLTRRAATKAELSVRLVGTVSTVVPAGTIAYPDGDATSQFQTTANATILEQGATDYVDVTMEAVTAGPETRAFTADSPLTIQTPVSGLTEIQVLSDYSPGQNEETDAALRSRREQALAQGGSSTVAAIRAAVLNVTGVDTCRVFENPTASTDEFGVPPYAFEVLVTDIQAPSYTNQDLADAIFAVKPAGTLAHGNITETTTDSEGNTYTIGWSEPTNVNIYVTVTLFTTTDGTFIGKDGVKQAIVDWSLNALGVGESVYVSDIINVVADLQGVDWVSATQTYVGDVNLPSTQSWTAAGRELGVLSTARILVIQN